MELRLDLSDPALCGAPANPSLDITVGLRLADMDGTPGESWPWGNGAYGTMSQLSPGLQPGDYATDIIRMPDAAEPAVVGDWEVSDPRASALSG